MIPELVYAIQACARIGAIHNVIFAGFSPESIAKRLEDCHSEYIITVDEGLRGSKKFALKYNIDEALKQCSQKIKKCVVVKATGSKIEWDNEIDVWYNDLVAN